MYNRILLFLTIAIINLGSAQAQVIVLSCKSQLTKKYLDEFPKFWEEMCDKYQGDNCDRAQEARDNVKQCLQSNLSYSHKREFTFDKKSLNDRKESWAAVVMQTCWGVDEKFRNQINATPTVISFITKDSSFNVDRETLKGGWNAELTWQCEVREKILKNKI